MESPGKFHKQLVEHRSQYKSQRDEALKEIYKKRENEKKRIRDHSQKIQEQYGPLGLGAISETPQKALG